MAKYLLLGNGLVVDPKSGKRLIRFEIDKRKNFYLGSLVIEDDKTIDRLKELGFFSPELENKAVAGGWELLEEGKPKRGRKKKEEAEKIEDVQVDLGETVE